MSGLHGQPAKVAAAIRSSVKVNHWRSNDAQEQYTYSYHMLSPNRYTETVSNRYEWSTVLSIWVYRSSNYAKSIWHQNQSPKKRQTWSFPVGRLLLASARPVCPLRTSAWSSPAANGSWKAPVTHWTHQAEDWRIGWRFEVKKPWDFSCGVSGVWDSTF